MNKRIIISLGVIGVAAAAVVGGTIAYFNDTETSTGNVFVAGSLDLKVDHLLQSYNDVYCNTCTVEIQSDTSNQVVWTDVGADPTPMPHPAVEVSNPHSAWTASIPGADWIWATDPTIQADAGQEVVYTFRNTFEWMGPIEGVTLNLGVGADNSYEVWLNGSLVAGDNSERNFDSSGQDTYTDGVVLDNVQQGLNTIEFKVKNWEPQGFQGTPSSNPGGLLYRLVIDGQCGDNYFKNHCTLWGEKDIEQGDYFFNFQDVKPGDSGRNVISLHAYDNDAWACLIVHDKRDQDNGLTEPEEEAGDGTPLEGELSQFIEVFGWMDLNQDGVYDAGETSLFEGSLAGDPVNLMVADSNEGEPLTGSETYYVGLAWCAGTQTVNPETQEISCNGSGMGDVAQTDSLTASLTAYAEQWRNNAGFTCEGVQLEPEPQLE